MTKFIVTTKQGIRTRYEIEAASEQDAEKIFLATDPESIEETETAEEVVDIIEAR